MRDYKGTHQERVRLVDQIAREQVNIVRSITVVNLSFRDAAGRAQPKLHTAAKSLMTLQALAQELKDFDRLFPNPKWEAA